MDVVYAKYAAQIETPDGGRHSVFGGQHWPADDPVVQANPAIPCYASERSVAGSAA